MYKHVCAKMSQATLARCPLAPKYFRMTFKEFIHATRLPLTEKHVELWGIPHVEHCQSFEKKVLTYRLPL